MSQRKFERARPNIAARMAAWAVVGLALASLQLATMLVSAAPPSVCEDRLRIDASLAALPFLFFVASGAWTVARAHLACRLALFLGVSLVAAGYVWGLSMTFEDFARFVAACRVRDQS